MPIILADGIVTRYVNYRENDRIISIFTVDRGMLTAKARGARKPTSALLPVCQPFVYGQFELFSGKDKFTVDQCEIKETFFPLREDYEKFSMGSAMLQLVHAAVQENQPNEPLFSLLYHALSFLAYGEGDPRDLLCGFLIRYLNVIGYRPSITSCARCGRDVRKDGRLRFSPVQGGVVCTACSGADATDISPLALEAMRRMLLLPDDDMHKIRLTDALRGEIMPALTGYVATVLDYGARALQTLYAELMPENGAVKGEKM